MSDAKLAKADAKAAKAKAKALRPWFQKKRIIVPIALIVIIGISVATSGGGNKAGSANAGGSSSSTEETEKALGIGDVAVDGNFSFTVTALKCGIKSVGSKYFSQKPQGQFCQMSLNIENTGSEAQLMFADSQKAFDAEGREFSPDTSSMIYVKDGAETWLKEINPGNTLKGSILFDIPKDATLERVELHDSSFSSGVTVNLK